MLQEKLFRFAMDHSLEIMVFFDTEGNILYGNETARDILEYGEDLYDYLITDIFPELCIWKDGQLQMAHPLGTLVSGSVAYRRNRTCFTVDASIQQDKEQPGVYLCMAVDVSKQDYLERRAAQVEQKAEEAQKVKSQFVANVTHELRTPVNGILGNTRELIEKESDPSKQKILKLVERGCDDMHAIINNILDFSKLEAGKFTLETRPFSFRNMMDYVKNNHINKITEKGLELFVRVSPDVPETIIGDELRIVQILNNLLSNACKFTSVGKIIVEVIKTAQVGNRVELFFLVIDSGIGIDEAGQDKLFKSFSQVDASISRKYGGTGLGLNICQQLVELMDGNIHVESKLGKGTTFSFHIWVEVEQGTEDSQSETVDARSEIKKLTALASSEEEDKIWQYGEKENLEEIHKKMSKLILCVDMENWEKAEMFADALKQLMADAPREVKSGALRLKMAVQKEDYDKIKAAYETLQELME